MRTAELGWTTGGRATHELVLVWSSNPIINELIGDKEIVDKDRLTQILEPFEKSSSGTVVYKEYWLGRTYYCYGFFASAIPHFRKAIEAPLPDETSKDDLDRRDRFLIGRSWGHLGSIYSAPFNFAGTDISIQNDWESMECYKKEATVFHYPGSMYIYGKALVYGTDGVEKDVRKGIEYLIKAGAEGIGEAYFELGSIYERGMRTGQGPGGLEKSIGMATDYYLKAERVYVHQEKWRTDGWTPEIWRLKDYLFCEVWNQSESIISEMMGQRFGWNVAGQSFLFSAAAHFGFGGSRIKAFLPILGIILAFFFMAMITEAIYRIGYERKQFDIMLETKIAAYKAIVKAVEKSLGNMAHPFKKAVPREKERYRSYKRWCYVRKRLNTLVVVLAYLVFGGFLGGWITLLVTDFLVQTNDGVIIKS